MRTPRRRHCALVGALALMVPVHLPHPAHATSRTTVAYQECTEVTAISSATTLRTSIAIVSFACEDVEVDGRPVGAAAVSEVVALQPDASFALLRTATDNAALRGALVAAGLPAVHATEISVTPLEAPPHEALPSPGLAARVVLRDSTLHIGAPGAPLPSTSEDEDGLAYWYAGPRGIVTNAYTNTLSGTGHGAGPSAATVDAREDPQLADWLGVPTAPAGAVVVKGSWTAEVTTRR